MEVNNNPTGRKNLLYSEELRLYVLATGTGMAQAHQTYQGILEILG